MQDIYKGFSILTTYFDFPPDDLTENLSSECLTETPSETVDGVPGGFLCRGEGDASSSH